MTNAQQQRRRWLGAGVFVLAAAVWLAFAAFGNTSASFTDRITFTGGTVGAAALQVPALTASVSDTTVSLAWTNPDGLNGAPGGFQVVRAAGACTAAGSFAAIAGSPFATSTTSTTDAPGDGTHCYAVQAVYENWLSPLGSASSANQATVTVTSPTTPPTQTLGFSGAAADNTACGASWALNGSGGAAFVELTPGTSASWSTGPGMTVLPAGGYTATITRTANSGATQPTTFTVEIGVCSNGTFTVKGSASDQFLSANESKMVNFTIATSTNLASGDTIVVRITNTGAANPGGSTQRNLRVVTSGSGITGPSPFNP